MDKMVLAGLENIAETMGCSRKTLCKWIQTKGFPAFKMDGVWRALPVDVEDWLRQQRALNDTSTRLRPPSAPCQQEISGK